MIKNYFLSAVVLLGSFASISTPALAQTPVKAAENKKRVKPREVHRVPPPVETLPAKQAAPSPWSSKLVALRAGSLYTQGDGSRYDGVITKLKSKYSFGSGYALAFETGWTQNLVNHTDDFTDTSLDFLKSGIELGDYLVIEPSGGVIGATSKRSRDVLSFRWGARVGALLAINPKINPQLTLSASLSGGQNFYEYSTDTSGGIVSKYTLTEIYKAGYSWGNLGIEVYYAHRNGWTYKDTTNEAFEICEEISYLFHPSWVALLGHTNGGAALAANGQDANVQIINEKDSIVYGGLVFLF